MMMMIEEEDVSVVWDEREECVYVERLETVKFLNMTVVESRTASFLIFIIIIIYVGPKP